MGESLYFCFTSLTTIGFGDYFPETPSGHVFSCSTALLDLVFYLSSLALCNSSV